MTFSPLPPACQAVSLAGGRGGGLPDSGSGGRSGLQAAAAAAAAGGEELLQSAVLGDAGLLVSGLVGAGSSWRIL